MEFNTINTKLSKIHNGTWFSIVTKTDVPLSAYGKSLNVNITKITVRTVRKGINYSNLSRVKNESSFNSKSRELPWGNWMNNSNVFIEHCPKGAGIKNIYLRMYTSPNTPKSIYLLNGKETTIDYLKNSGYIQNNYFKDSGFSDTMTINIKNIISIG